MHFVLQQEWINGKSYLVKDGERDSLLEILNLPSEAAEKEGEAEMVAKVREPEEVMQLQEATPETGVGPGEELDGEPELLGDVVEEMAGEDVLPAGLETPEEPPAEGQDQAAGEEDMAVTWYYWPNGIIWRG